MTSTSYVEGLVNSFVDPTVHVCIGVPTKHAGIFTRNPVRKITPRSSQISSKLPQIHGKRMLHKPPLKSRPNTSLQVLNTHQPEKCTKNVHIYRKIITPNYHTLSVGLHI